MEADRVEIATRLTAGWSVRVIAVSPGRAPSVASREIQRNATATQGYRLVTAHARAGQHRRRPQVGKTVGDWVLAALLVLGLRVGSRNGSAWRPGKHPLDRDLERPLQRPTTSLTRPCRCHQRMTQNI